jgi:hypothetical protein
MHPGVERVGRLRIDVSLPRKFSKDLPARRMSHRSAASERKPWARISLKLIWAGRFGKATQEIP